MNISKYVWPKVKLSDVCERVYLIDSRRQMGFINYVDIGSINSELNRIENIQKLEWKNASSRARQVIKEFDTLFSTVRVNLKRIAFIKNEIPNGIASTGFTVLRAKQELIDPYFLFINSINPTFINRLILLQAGTAYPAVSDRIVFNQEIPLPPLDEQQRIVDLFQSLEACINRLQEQNDQLSRLKSQLLVELFNNKKFGTSLQESDFEEISFSKIANNISERVEPKETHLGIYVGLEHLDSGDLVIRRKGKPSDVIGTKLKIFKGDIIFGKRRAYLRKLAVSDFDGIASAHSMILRANEKAIEKDFLPYFMQSDTFMNRAVQISEGSLSPTIKWKTLADQKFTLPKMVKQPRLIEIFKQLDTTSELIKKQVNLLKELKQNLLNEILGG